jgi:phospholipid-transporting ATPase
MTQVVLASIGAIFGASWVTKYQEVTSYLGTTDGEKHPFKYYLIQQIGTWILIFTNFVPISLMVSLEMVKFWQAGFMTKDH